MAHPTNKHHRLVIAIKKGLKRASTQWCHKSFEKLDRSNMDPEWLVKYEADYIKDTKTYRDTTMTRRQTGNKKASMISEFRPAYLNRHNISLKNLELVYEPIKAYDMEYLFV
jgi:hypothetical protein